MNIIKNITGTGTLSRKYIFLISVLIISIFYFIFENFFPNMNGKLGHDFSLYMPQLIDGTYWYHNNGLFEVPWFTPSFGGGLPNFPHPQGTYYSIPQVICLFAGPMGSIKLTLLLFGAIGFTGFYFLLRKMFSTSVFSALLGATLFLFSGYFAHRIIIGHLPCHPFTLFPFLAIFTFRSLKSNQKNNVKMYIADVILGAFIVAYMVYCGGVQLIPVFLLGIMIFCFLFDFLQETTFKYSSAFVKIGLIFILGFTLSAAKLNASIYYNHLFPRDFYPLPGFENIFDIIIVALLSLFWKSPWVFAIDKYVNSEGPLGPHEYENGVGLVPFLIIVVGAILYIRKSYKTNFLQHFAIKKIIKMIFLLTLLFIPIILNYYTPSWNGFLKTIPFIKNSSTNIRWLFVYIPIVILVACVMIEKISWFNKNKILITSLGILIVIITNLFADRQFYHDQPYNPQGMIQAYDKLQSGEFTPEITRVGITASKPGTGKDTAYYSNDVFIEGMSQLFPYEPMFGYRLEQYPKKSLRAGPVMSENSEGFLNFKNPASYVFPKENKCEPGDHFTKNQAESAEKLRTYHNFPFIVPPSQAFANYLTIISLSASMIYLIFYGFLIFKKNIRKREV